MKVPVFPKGERDIIADGKFVGFANTTEDRDFIVKTVNSYCNLVEYRQYVHARIADGKPIMRYSKWIDTVKELEQALKEVEEQ